MNFVTFQCKRTIDQAYYDRLRLIIFAEPHIQKSNPPPAHPIYCPILKDLISTVLYPNIDAWKPGNKKNTYTLSDRCNTLTWSKRGKYIHIIIEHEKIRAETNQAYRSLSCKPVARPVLKLTSRSNKTNVKNDARFAKDKKKDENEAMNMDVNNSRGEKVTVYGVQAVSADAHELRHKEGTLPQDGITVAGWRKVEIMLREENPGVGLELTKLGL